MSIIVTLRKRASDAELLEFAKIIRDATHEARHEDDHWLTDEEILETIRSAQEDK